VLINDNKKLILTNNEEKNKDIANYYVKGLNYNKFIKIISKKIKTIKSNSNYKTITFDFLKKYNYKQLEEIFLNLNNSEIVKLELLGKSSDNRNIYSIEIGKGKNITLFEAGVHAREIANPLFIIKYMVDLVNKYEENNEEIKKMLNDNKIVILPLLNPDGYEAFLFGKQTINDKKSFLYNNYIKYFKTNINGVDLNRNMPSQTSGLHYLKNKLNSKICMIPSLDKFYAGNKLGSEKESEILIYFQYKYYKDLKLYVSLHSMGRIIYAGKPNLSDEFNNKCNMYGKIVKDISNYHLCPIEEDDEGSGLDGTTTDFIAELINGLKFSTKTGRLSKNNYEEKIITPLHKGAVILIESLNIITTDLNLIKNEYYKYNLEKVYTSLIKN